MFLGMCNRKGNVGKMSVMIQCRSSGDISQSELEYCLKLVCQHQQFSSLQLSGLLLCHSQNTSWWLLSPRHCGWKNKMMNFCSESWIKKNKADIKKPAMGSRCILSPVRVGLREKVGLGCQRISEPNFYAAYSISLLIHPKYNHRTCIHIGLKI